MADHKSLGVRQGDEHEVAIAQHIVKVYSTSENPNDDMIEFLSDLKISMSISGTAEALGNSNEMSEVDELLNSLHQKIMNWNSNRSMTWERGVDEAAEYVQDVEEIQRLIECLGGLSLNGYREKDELLQRAHSILQTAMSRLEEEFSHILIENRQPLEPVFRSSDDDMSFVNSIASVDDEPSKDTQVRLQKDNNRGLEKYIINLVHPHVIPNLKCIAEVMFVSSYDAECCQAYINIRKHALNECLLVLEVEKLSIEDVLQMDWSSLNSKIKKWIRVMKIFVRVYLANEKRLADQVFRFAGSVGKNCFIEASRSLIIPLLRFGEAVAIRNHSPEKIFRILNMYDGVADLLPDIDALFSDEAGSCVSTVAHEVLSRLGESVRRSLNEFKTAVKTGESSTPFAGGGVHPVTRYLMNYLKALTDYSDTLDCLLEGGGDDHSPSLSNLKMAVKNDSESSSSSSASPTARCLESVISILESNLESKSQLYTDVPLQHFFLMNNICYMVQKVKDSELQPLLGENWMRKQDEKFQQHAVNYERASWNPVLSFLRDEGIYNPRSGLVNKAILKERFQGFNLAFEEIYRTQTAWLIHNDQLGEDLTISISLKILQAYRTFMGRYSNNLAGERHYDRYIKYSVEDLQEFLLDLFDGSKRSLHRSQSPEEEFSHILIENKIPLELEHLPFQSSNDDMSSVDLIASVHDEPSEGTKVRPQRDNMRGSEEYVIDLVYSNVIPDLKRIAEVLFTLGYDAECCQAYVSVRKDALEECLLVLEVEKLSTDDVLQMDWSALNSKIKKWIRVMKIFVRVYLSNEKRLADQVFGVAGSVSQNCFIEASKSLIFRLLSFGEAVATRNHSPEKICPILGMCEGLMDLLPDINVLYSGKFGSCVSTEAHEVLTGLGESVMRTLNQFKNAVKTNELYTPFAGGGVHHLTKYLMKYVKALTDYSDSLNFLLEVEGEDHLPSSSNVHTAVDNNDDDDGWNSSPSDSPVAQCLQSIISILESNLESKSQLYTDVSLQHFFLMNNICYMVHKVKDSELQPFLGENWMRKQDGKFQHHAVNYERTSWSPVLSFLRDEGICNPRSDLVNKAILRERFQGFNLAFEKIYRTQKTWLIHNDQLRDDLRISVSLKVLLAYRSFFGRYSYQLAGKYIKYSAEDLHEFLLDLFEGSTKPLHKSHRR